MSKTHQTNAILISVQWLLVLVSVPMMVLPNSDIVIRVGNYLGGIACGMGIAVTAHYKLNT